MDSKAHTMMRAIGFLAGVGLTVAAFVLVLNTWDNRQPDTVMGTTVDPTPAEFAAVVEAIAEHVDVAKSGDESDQAVAPNPESGVVDPEPPNDSVEATGDGTPDQSSDASTAMLAQTDVVQAGNELDQPGTASGKPQHGFEESGPDQDLQPDDQAQAATDVSNREDTGATSTYLFWSPFHSEWAARGFAGRLTLSTQVPVEVVSAGPGNYRVAFNYRDEADRRARIERIETITGLKLE